MIRCRLQLDCSLFNEACQIIINYAFFEKNISFFFILVLYFERNKKHRFDTHLTVLSEAM